MPTNGTPLEVFVEIFGIDVVVVLANVGTFVVE
jgi:hypothetical protein